LKNDHPQAWKLYEEGRAYNSSLTPNQYTLVQTNTEFFIGNQWINLPNTPAVRGLPKPTFNILKRVASLFIASLTSSGIAMRFEPLAYYDGTGQVTNPSQMLQGSQWKKPTGLDAASVANAEMANLLEKFKFDYRVREALFDGAQTGDYCAHFYYDPTAMPYGGAFGEHRGEIQMELVDGINVMFGNPGVRDVQVQPYILLVGRDTVENLKWEAGLHGNSGDGIQGDMEMEWLPGSGGTGELLTNEEHGKATYILMYSKEMEGDEVTVHATKATRSAIIYENVDTGLSIYPVAWGNWERQKNQYHGRALVTGLIPNQIFINTMFATAMRHMQLMAFPKTVYNADLVSSWTNEVGQAIGIHGLQPGQSITSVAYNLQPAEMSHQIFALIDKAMSYTKECLGATDAQMGNVKPDNTSALMVLQTNSEVPLENIRAGLYEWVEDIGAILLDMMGTYYGSRPVVVEREFEDLVLGQDGVPELDPQTGQMTTRTTKRKIVQTFDFTQFKHLWLNLRIDVGATTYFSEIAMTQTLDNLRRDGTLDVIQYLERIPDKLIPKKQELLEQLKNKGGEQGKTLGAKGGRPVQGGSLDEDKLISTLPATVQTKYGQLDPWTKRAARLAAQSRQRQN